MVKPLEENYAPYTSARAIVDVIKRYRERGLPEPVTESALEQIGIPPSLLGLTFRALLFLALVDEGGFKTESFDQLRRASTEEYPNILAGIVRKAYLPVFTIVDPVQDDETAVADAFRRYDPANQRAKMVRLFMGLCQEAQIITRKTKRLRISSKLERPKIKAESPISKTTRETVNSAPSKEDIGTDYRLISAVIQHLPRKGYWSSEERKRWLGAMTSAVDLIIQVQEGGNPQAENIKNSAV
jgi:hypothetical protein